MEVHQALKMVTQVGNITFETYNIPAEALLAWIGDNYRTHKFKVHNMKGILPQQQTKGDPLTRWVNGRIASPEDKEKRYAVDASTGTFKQMDEEAELTFKRWDRSKFLYLRGEFMMANLVMPPAKDGTPYFCNDVLQRIETLDRRFGKDPAHWQRMSDIELPEAWQGLLGEIMQRLKTKQENIGDCWLHAMNDCDYFIRENYKLKSKADKPAAPPVTPQKDIERIVNERVRAALANSPQAKGAPKGGPKGAQKGGGGKGAQRDGAGKRSDAELARPGPKRTDAGAKKRPDPAVVYWQQNMKNQKYCIPWEQTGKCPRGFANCNYDHTCNWKGDSIVPACKDRRNCPGSWVHLQEWLKIMN